MRNAQRERKDRERERIHRELDGGGGGGKWDGYADEKWDDEGAFATAPVQTGLAPPTAMGKGSSGVAQDQWGRPV